MGFFKTYKQGKLLQGIMEDTGLNEFYIHLATTNYISLFESMVGRKPKDKEFIAENAEKEIRESMKHVVIRYKDENGKEKLKCGKCGKGLRLNDVYCPYCGTEAIDEKK